MTVKLFHAVAAILTMLLVFIKQKCAEIAGVCPAKRRAVAMSECSSGEPSLTSFLAPAERVRSNRAACAVTTCAQPKYKRDPVISVDNENIGQHPHDRTIMII